MSYFDDDEEMKKWDIISQKAHDEKLKNTEFAMAKLAWALHLNVDLSIIKEFAKEAVKYWRIEEPYCASIVSFAHPNDRLRDGSQVSIDDKLKFIFELPKDK